MKWKIISNTNGELLLLSENIIDAQEFNYKSDSNNWEISTIREWLNNYFYNMAFDNVQKQMISDTLLDNKTTGGICHMTQTPPYEIYYDSSNQYAITQNNTLDKVFLLSRKDTYDSSFAFSNNENDRRSTIIKEFTSYSVIQGLQINTHTTSSGIIEYADWMLRSPCMLYSNYVALPSTKPSGTWQSAAVDGVLGVLPAIKISINHI